MSGPRIAVMPSSAERDDAHLRSLGIKPELRRTLGFLSNFAIAFSFISVSTGSFGNFGVGHRAGRPGVLLVVADRHRRPDARRPRASPSWPATSRSRDRSTSGRSACRNRTLGWFTGWFYFWAQVVTVTAVAVIVAFVIDGIHGPMADGSIFLDSPDPTGVTTMFTFISLATLVVTTLINAFGVRLLSILNNIGVATEILGMFVFALILLFFANHQSPSVLFETGGAEAATGGNYLPAFAARHVHVAVHRLRLRHRRDVRRGDGRREPPGAARRPVVDLDLRRGRGGLPARRHPRASRASRTRWPRARPAGSRSRPRSSPCSRPTCSPGSPSASSTCSSSSPRSSSAPWRSRARRPG